MDILSLVSFMLMSRNKRLWHIYFIPLLRNQGMVNTQNTDIFGKMTTGCTPMSTESLITLGSSNQFQRFLSNFVEKCLVCFYYQNIFQNLKIPLWNFQFSRIFYKFKTKLFCQVWRFEGFLIHLTKY